MIEDESVDILDLAIHFIKFLTSIVTYVSLSDC
jgi:hypothetical protein